MKIVLQNKNDIVIAAVLVGAAVLVQLLVASPKRKALEQRKGRVKQLELQIAQSSAVVGEMATFLASDSTGTHDYDRPEAEILPDLLDAIAELGQRHGVEIVSMRPSALERFPIQRQEPIPITAQATRLVVSVVARARYHAIGQYMGSLGDIPILVSVENVRINRMSPKSPVLRIEFDIETYTIRTNEEAK